MSSPKRAMISSGVGIHRVGAGTIGQTVFANAMEHLGEFATLKAMGATARDLNTIILAQAAIDASVASGSPRRSRC